MSGKLHPILVIGAGIAGSTTALLLARNGCDVTLVEKSSFPRDKVCGCCLNGAAIRQMSRLNLLPQIQRAGAQPLSQFRLFHNKKSAVVTLRGGLALSRSRLDFILAQAARDAGVKVHFEVEAKIRQYSDWQCSEGVATVELRQSNSSSIFTGIVIVASGLAGSALPSSLQREISVLKPRSYIGCGVRFPAPLAEEKTISMLSGDHGYLGLVQDEQGFCNLAAALDPQILSPDRTLPRWIADTLTKHDFPLPAGFYQAQFRGTPALTRHLTRTALPGIFFVGDAAGYIEPFTGEGMSWAFEGAELLAPIVQQLAKADLSFAEAAYRWQARYRTTLMRRQRLCRLLATGLRSKWIWSFGVTALPWCTPLATYLVRSLHHAEVHS